MTRIEICRKYKIIPQTLDYRIKNVFGEVSKFHSFSHFEIERIVYMEKYKRVYKPRLHRYHKDSIKIVEYFLNNKNNSIDTISSELKVPRYYVIKIINHFLKEKEIILESKINN